VFRRRRATDGLPELADVPTHDAAGRPVRVVLLGRPGCHLCDVARAQVRTVAEECAVGWVERSIEDSAALLGRYAELVPVVLVDGREHAHYRVRPEALRAALGRRRGRRR